MSTSQRTPFPQDISDQNMMEAPDSPPEITHLPSANQSFSSQPHSGSQQANSSRLNGDNAKVNHGAPGSNWSSKKFHDEYDRAYSTLIDQQWDSTRYGDPLIKS